MSCTKPANARNKFKTIMEHMDLDWYWSNIMPNIVDLDGNCLLHSIGSLGSSELDIPDNLDRAICSGKCCKVAALHSGHVSHERNNLYR